MTRLGCLTSYCSYFALKLLFVVCAFKMTRLLWHGFSSTEPMFPYHHLSDYGKALLRITSLITSERFVYNKYLEKIEKAILIKLV